MAFASNYPTELRPKLHLRAAQCWIKLYDASRADEQLTKAQNLITIDENISADDRGWNNNYNIHIFFIILLKKKKNKCLLHNFQCRKCYEKYWKINNGNE